MALVLILCKHAQFDFHLQAKTALTQQQPRRRRSTFDHLKKSPINARSSSASPSPPPPPSAPSTPSRKASTASTTSSRGEINGAKQILGAKTHTHRRIIYYLGALFETSGCSVCLNRLLSSIMSFGISFYYLASINSRYNHDLMAHT